MIIVYDFAFYLTLAVAITGLIFLLDVLWWAKKRPAGKRQSWVIEYARAFFPVLLIVWLIRSFVVQPYRVPTSSLTPTIYAGDFIAVNQFAYGLRFPIGNAVLVPIGEPKRGQIALFYYPRDPNYIYIKRVIGLPGDHISYHDKQLTINGEPISEKFLDSEQYTDDNGQVRQVDRYQEDLMGVKHFIFVEPLQPDDYGVYRDVVVPPGHYFMLGDNRDDSGDSRVWGLVPSANLIGRAFGIWMSWDPHATAWKDKIRWQRLGGLSAPPQQ